MAVPWNGIYEEDDWKTNPVERGVRFRYLDAVHNKGGTVGTVTVRKARPEDGAALLHLVDALAYYEKLNPPDESARQRLLDDIFGRRPRLEAFIAESDGTSIGYAFILETYSSFLALPSLYLEDLFVLPEYRNRKAGYALFMAAVAEAGRRGCGRMEWMVLDWNQTALDFYNRLGATHMKEWQLYRLVQEDFRRLLQK